MGRQNDHLLIGALLPPARRVLAVCAHPDDESFGLGGIISAYVTDGAEVNLVCLTRGEASTLGADRSELAKARTSELHAAARQLGITSLEICDHPDGRLPTVSLGELVISIRPHAGGIDLVLVFDEGGITGHPDHIQATAAALSVADEIDVPVLAWALPDTVANALNDEFHTRFVGRPAHEIDVSIPVDRARQYAAIRCHGSQLTDNPIPDRRLALTGSNEALRWLRR